MLDTILEFHPSNTTWRNASITSTLGTQQDWTDPTDTKIRERLYIAEPELAYHTIVMISAENPSYIIQWQNNSGTAVQQGVRPMIVQTYSLEAAQDRILRFRRNADNVRVASLVGTILKNISSYVREIHSLGTAVAVQVDDGRIVHIQSNFSAICLLKCSAERGRQHEPRRQHGLIFERCAIGTRDVEVQFRVIGVRTKILKDHLKDPLDAIHSNKALRPSGQLNKPHVPEVETSIQRHGLALGAAESVLRAPQGLLEMSVTADRLDLKDHATEVGRQRPNATSHLDSRWDSGLARYTVSPGEDFGSSLSQDSRHRQHMADSGSSYTWICDSKQNSIRRTVEAEDVLPHLSTLSTPSEVVLKDLQMSIFLMLGFFAKNVIQLEAGLAALDLVETLDKAGKFGGFQTWVTALIHVADSSSRAFHCPQEHFPSVGDRLRLSDIFSLTTAHTTHEKIICTLRKNLRSSLDAPRYYLTGVATKASTETRLWLVQTTAFQDKGYSGQNFGLELCSKHIQDPAEKVRVEFQLSIDVHSAEHPVSHCPWPISIPSESLSHLRHVSLKLGWDGQFERVATWEGASYLAHSQNMGVGRRGFVTALMACLLQDQVLDSTGEITRYVRSLKSGLAADVEADLSRIITTMKGHQIPETPRTMLRALGLMDAGYDMSRLENVAAQAAMVDGSDNHGSPVKHCIQGRVAKSVECDRCRAIKARTYPCTQVENGTCSNCRKSGSRCTWTV